MQVLIFASATASGPNAGPSGEADAPRSATSYGQPVVDFKDGLSVSVANQPLVEALNVISQKAIVAITRIELTQPLHQPTEKQYKNEKYGYTVKYPHEWFPSGIVYGNAFEIRNYDPKHSKAIVQQDQASVLIMDMPMGNAEEARRFLDGLLAQGGNAEREVKVLTIDGHRAVRVKQRVEAQELGRGTLRRFATPPVSSPASIFHINIYIANGALVIQLWGKVAVKADPGVIDEIGRIQESVTFKKRRSGGEQA